MCSLLVVESGSSRAFKLFHNRIFHPKSTISSVLLSGNCFLSSFEDSMGYFFSKGRADFSRDFFTDFFQHFPGFLQRFSPRIPFGIHSRIPPLTLLGSLKDFYWDSFYLREPPPGLFHENSRDSYRIFPGFSSMILSRIS